MNKNLNDKYILVWDNGGIFVKLSLFSNAQQLKYNEFSIEKISSLKELVTLVKEVAICYEKELNIKIYGIAVSWNSPISKEKYCRKVHYQSGDIDLQDLLIKQNVPGAHNFSIINDGKASLIAEVAYGAAKDVKNVTFLAFGTGIAGGVLNEGKLVNGPWGMGGEFSLVFMNIADPKLTWNSVSSMYSLQVNYKEKTGKELMGKEIYKLWENNDPIASEVVEQQLKAIATICFNVYNLYGSEMIIIGGGLSNNLNILKPIKKYLSAIIDTRYFDYNADIKLAHLHSHSAAFGAYNYFIQKYAEGR